jgi:4'-phosphopantetheinyl transferase
MVNYSRIWSHQADFVLLPGDVHVWCAELDWPANNISTLRETLSLDERERADRFRFNADQMRYVIGRAMSRSLLGRYLRIAPECVKFARTNEGKPILAMDVQETPFDFNVSHSGDFVLLALARGRRVGIDIELISRTVGIEAIALRFFSKREYACLTALPTAIRHEAFYCCWTRKEAYLKARGDGLSLALDAFDVTFLPDEMPRLIETRHDAQEISRWTLQDLDFGPNYKAALATEGAHYELKLWNWTNS